ncbi:MAG: DHA2 family efflux MFS transporter permease subunit [Actinomycetota bacterium]|nr:DHA2 family efflux MFS transporter permease subunit [Actinomycetota bacterium]MDQ6945432.1 DHA2 family efflux MFS transporter permease subunit [Actinomycetota bacterium]
MPTRSTVYERRWWTLSVLCLSLVMIVVANASLNVAIPTLVKDLHAGSSALQWIVDGYSLVFAGLLLTAGAVGDRYGRRLALNVGLVVFGTASGLAAIAGSSGQLIAARAVMGLGAALVMPATLSVLAHVFPPEERTRAIAIWAGFAGVGAGLGGVSSGWLLQHFWWGSIFLTNVGVVIVALVAGAFLVPSARSEHGSSLDPTGAVLSITGLGALIYAIIEAPGRGWASWPTIGSFAAAAVIMVAFAAWELRVADPMLDLRFFRNPRFTAAASTITLIFFVMFGMIFILTQYLQSVLGYSPLEAGVRMLPWAVVYVISAPRSARLVERFGHRWVVSSGLGVVAAGLALLARSGVHANYPVLALSLVVTAAGMGMVTAPSTGAIVASLPLNKAGVGSAVNDTTRELGGALGVAVIGSALASLYRGDIAARIAGMPAPAHAATASLGAALRAANGLPGPAGDALATAARLSYVHAFDLTIVITVAVAILASGLVAWLLRPARVEPASTDAVQEDGVVLEAA